jgi:hypothetical protein
MPTHIRPDLLTEQLAGRRVSHVSKSSSRSLKVYFIDGSVLSIEPTRTGLTASVEAPPRSATDAFPSTQPTLRQREYLRFIARYITRFGRPPAESDIQRHFLVSAPSVNQMIQALEKRGFITRQPGVPRSICVCFNVSDENAATTGLSHDSGSKEHR